MLHVAQGASKLRAGIIVAMVGALTAGGLMIQPPDAYANDVSEDLLAAIATPEVDWSDCEDGFECGTLSVPLDYAEPDGEFIDLSVIRKPATSDAARIGSLVTNPGGPGGSGVSYLRAVGTDNPITEEIDVPFATLNESFDLVSWDPRGTTGSEPIDCLREDESADSRFPSGLRNTPADADLLRDQAQRITSGCVNSVGADLLGSVSTLNSARDMEMLRRALGEEQISYLGFSYGTILGATYAAHFGDRLRANVLDGALDSETYFRDPRTFDFLQAEGFEVGLGRIFESCEEAGCEFEGGQEAWTQLLEDLRENPIPSSSNPNIAAGEAELYFTTFSLIRMPEIWEVYDIVLADLQEGDADLLIQLAFILFGSDGEEAELGADAFTAISGVDRDYGVYPTGHASTYPDYVESSPTWGNLFWGSSSNFAKATWPVEANAIDRGPFDNPAEQPALVVGTTFDPSTPYSQSIELANELGNARLLTMNGDGHLAYKRGSTCIDLAVEAYLINLDVPEEGKECQQGSGVEAAGSGEEADQAAKPDLDKVAELIREHPSFN